MTFSSSYTIVQEKPIRFLVGGALAIHPDGRLVSVDLDEIYGRAAEAFGPGVLIRHQRDGA